MCRLTVRAAEAQVLEGRAGVSKLSEKLSTAPLNAPYLDAAGPNSRQPYNAALLKWRPHNTTRRALRILSGDDDLPAAQRWNADRGADVREFWTASESRGVAVQAGEKETRRVHTDGKICCSLISRSAAWVVAAAKVNLKADVSNLSFGIRALQKLVLAGVLVQDADCKVRAGKKLLRLRQEISEDLTAADVLSFWLDCAFVSGRTAAHCIPGCWAGLYHWMRTALPLDDAKVRTEFGVVDRVAALDAFHSMPEYYSDHHPYFQNIVWNDGKGDVLDDLFRGVHDEVVIRFYDPSTGALAAPKYEFTRELVEAISYGGPLERVRLSQENPIVRAFVKDWAQLSLKLKAPATGLRYGDPDDKWMLDERAFADVFSADFRKDNGYYTSTLMGGIRYALFARNAKGELELLLDKGVKPPVNASTVFWASAARDVAIESDAVLEAKRRYDAQCYASLPTEVAPSLDADAQAAHDAARDAAIEIKRRVAADRASAEAKRRAAGRFAETTVRRPRLPKDLRPRLPEDLLRDIRHATVVPPVEGSTTYFVNVSRETRRRKWKAQYNDEEPSRERRTWRTLAYYPSAELAARARYHHICDNGFEQFNMMDVRDDATGLMVPRERKKPREHKKRPPPPTFAVVDGSESRSGRVRKATKR